MSNYHLCCQHQGKVVHIFEKNGKIHHGRIVKVDQEYVWIDPVVTGPRGFGYGYSYGQAYGGYQTQGYNAYGGGYPGYNYGGYGHGHGGGRNPYFVPVALAAVGGLALGAAFFW
ncbi:hypothetical protein RJD24_17315 [Bacillaceae bacterium IKA-2]|nr:hypothetical protein RJD24_17315 [Bacillaceae bacterium IKA-2]